MAAFDLAWPSSCAGWRNAKAGLPPFRSFSIISGSSVGPAISRLPNSGRWSSVGRGTELCQLYDVPKAVERVTVPIPVPSIMLPRNKSMKARVVHITSAHSPLDSRIFYKECRSLAHAGYEVILLGAHVLNEYRDGVMLLGLGKSRSRAHRMSAKLIALCWEAFRLDADLYHVHDPELVLVALLLRVAGKRVIYDIHEDLPRTVHYKRYVPRYLRTALMWLVEAVENFSAKRMTGLIAATPTILRRFARMHSKTAVINNFPIQDELVSAYTGDWRNREMSIAYIGSTSEERGIREMLKAIALLPPSLGVGLELAGHFSSSSLQQEIAARPEWRHVHWHGVLNRKDICSLLGRVRVGLVVLHPEQNFIYSQPIKLFEYMAAGIPVIASDFPLWRSIIEESGCGLLVNPLEPQAIAAAIERLVSDSVLAEAMGRRGRKAVEQRYNWIPEERTLLSFYSSILSSVEAPVAQQAVFEASQGMR